MRCDVTVEAEVQALIAHAVDTFGRLDVMINNAGLGGTTSILDMTDDEWSRVLDVTLNGTFRCTRAALRQMVAQGGGGAIVNNASVIGWRAQEGQAHYAAAKAGVMALTRCAALDAAQHNIRVNAVSPSLAMHPHLVKVTSEDLLARAHRARGVRPLRRAVGGRQRDGVPGQRLLVLHDRRGRLGQQPARMSADDRPDQAPSRRTARDRRAAVRRTRAARDHRARHRRCGRHPVRQPLSPLRLEGVDGRRDPAQLPRRPVRPLPRDRRAAARPAGHPRSGRRRVVRSHRRAQRGRRDLPGRGAPPRRPAALRLHPRPTRRVPQRSGTTCSKAGVADGSFRDDLDVELAYRFLRDTVWVGVGWYRPGGAITIDAIAQQYLSIVLDGIATRTGSTRRPAKRK